MYSNLIEFKKRDSSLFLLSIGLLVLGILYYLLFREPIITSQYLGLESLHINLPLIINFDWLPSFVHQFSFVLLTWLALERTYKWFALLFWFSINVGFELIQILPITNYIFAGTYSHADMVAIFIATYFAHIMMEEKS